MSAPTKPKTTKTAEHRPATRKRRWRHDDLTACDLFSGFGGLTKGIERAGFTTIMAANHKRYKVEVHEANHPEAQHWIADLVDEDSGDYHSARDLPKADLLAAGVSCTNHSPANTMKAYEQGLSLFDMDADPDYDARVTKSERDRATANCVLHYAAEHHPRVIIVECTTELVSWGPAVQGKTKVGDGSTYRWWLAEFAKLGYRHRVLYLNSMFFGVPQSRDRAYWAFWDASIPTPDLDHRPHAWCGRCVEVVEGVWTWRTGVPPTGSVRYGKQYDYRCPRCRGPVVPPMTPSLAALDLSNLGTRIGDKPVKRHRDATTGPHPSATMARAERCRQRFPEFPPVVIPAGAVTGTEGHPWSPRLAAGSVIAAHRHNGDGQPLSRPMDTATATHEKAIVTTGALMAAAGNTFEWPGSDCRSRDLAQPLWAQTATGTTGLITPPVAVAVSNYQGAARGVDEPLPTQVGSETLSLVSAQVMPNRTNATGRDLSEPMATLVGGAGSGGLGVLSSGVVPFRQNTIPTVHAEAMPTVTADQIPGLLTAAGTIRNNGAIGEAAYRAHPLSDPLGTLVGSAASQAVLFGGWYKQNGSTGTETAPHPMSDSFGTLTARDTTALLMAEWRAQLADVALEDCFFRMMGPHEVGRGCGFDVDFPGYTGEFIVWGSAKDQVDGYGNAVSPQVGEWIGTRLRAALHGGEVAA